MKIRSLGVLSCVVLGTVKVTHAGVLEETIAISGKLEVSRHSFGYFLELIQSEEKSYCVVPGKVELRKIKKFDEESVTISGNFQRFAESEDCLTLSFDGFNIPCGYCLGEVIVADDIVKVN